VPDLVFREVTSKTWSDFEQLFESRGGPKNCWCMVFRAVGEETRRTDGASRKAAMKKRVKADIPVGLLGYRGKLPVAWCSIAPKPTYRTSLAGTRDGDEDENVWSLVCFFVTRAERGAGLLEQLIEAAKAHAKKRGATVLEAYPVDEGSPSYRFGGFLASFKRAGFTKIGRAGTRRHVVRYPLT